MNHEKLSKLKPGDKISITVSGKKQGCRIRVNNPEKQFMVLEVKYQRVKHKATHVKQFDYTQLIEKSAPFDYKKPMGVLVVGVLAYFLGPRVIEHSDTIIAIVNKIMESL